MKSAGLLDEKGSFINFVNFSHENACQQTHLMP